MKRPLLVVAASVFVVMSLMVVIADESEGMPSGRGGFCTSPTIRDYEAVFEGLPPVQPLPPSGETPFSPPDVRINGLRLPGQRVTPVGGRLPGFQIENRNRSAAVSLDWKVISRLERMSTDGAVLEESITVASIPPGGTVHIGGGTVTTPGIVRQDLAFVSSSGQPLGTYAEYIRVMRTKQVRIGLAKAIRRPGETLLSRVENLGSEPVGYGRKRHLERLTKTGWKTLPGNNVGFDSRSTALPGTAGKCQRTKIPRSAVNGRYRLSQEVTQFVISDRNRKTIRVSFAVVGGNGR